MEISRSCVVDALCAGAMRARLFNSFLMQFQSPIVLATLKISAF
jgi:hypothetical protein